MSTATEFDVGGLFGDDDASPDPVLIGHEVIDEQHGEPDPAVEQQESDGVVCGGTGLASDSVSTEGEIAAAESQDSHAAAPAATSTVDKSEAERDWESDVGKATTRYAAVAIEHKRAADRAKSLKKQMDDALTTLQDIIDDGPKAMPLFDQPARTHVELAKAVAAEWTSPDGSGWKVAPIEALNLKPKLTERLKESGADTIGQLEQLRADISNAHAVWPKGIGAAKITEIEDAVIDWLTKNRDRAAFAFVPDEPVASETQDAPAETSPTLDEPNEGASEGQDAPTTTAKTKKPRKRKGKAADGDQPASYMTFDDWEKLSKANQTTHIDDLANQFEEQGDLKPVNQPATWDNGRQAFGEAIHLEDCPYIPGHEQDDWIRGWLSAEKLAKAVA